MTKRTCVSLTANTTEGQRADARKGMARGATLVEHRLDSMNDLSQGKILELLKDKEYPVIVTNRVKSQGGNFEGKDFQRAIPLITASALEPEHIDIELGTEESVRSSLIRTIRGSAPKTKIIISTHFTRCTPGLDMLLEAHRMSVGIGADIVKVVTFANSPADNEVIYRFIEKAVPKGVPIISFAMGPIGSETRIKSVKMGAYLTFACLEKGKEAAPGQIPIDEMVKQLQ